MNDPTPHRLMAEPIDEHLAELAVLLATEARLKERGIRPQAVRQAVLDVIDEVYELVNEEE